MVDAPYLTSFFSEIPPGCLAEGLNFCIAYGACFARQILSPSQIFLIAKNGGRYWHETSVSYSLSLWHLPSIFQHQNMLNIFKENGSLVMSCFAILGLEAANVGRLLECTVMKSIAMKNSVWCKIECTAKFILNLSFFS